MLKDRAAICRDLNMLRSGPTGTRRNSKADVKSHTWDEKQQEPVQAAGRLLKKQICRKGQGGPHGHKLNLSQQRALQQKLTPFQVPLAGALPAG